MYILKNAWKSIVRNKVRNILVGIIVLAISCSCCIALAIMNTSSALVKSYENKYDITATISVNRSNMMREFNPSDDDARDNLLEEFESIGKISLEEVEKYADSAFVSSYYYTYSVGLDGSGLTPASMERKESGNGRRTLVIRGEMNAISGASTDFRLTGYSSIEAMNEFISGSYSIIEGEVSDEVNSCVINSELAALNEINVGDTIKLVDPDNTEKTYSLKVTGIFEEKSENEDVMSMFSASVNNIITTSETIEGIVSKNEDLATQLSPTFILLNKEVVDLFESELYSKGLNENLSLQTNIDQIENATDTITNVSSFALTFLFAIFIIGGIVLLVINAINIRERKYEIGVLRTIGMKKTSLACQFMLELLIVSSIALIIGAGIGASLSVPVSNQLLANEISSSQKETENIGQNFGGPSLTIRDGNGGVRTFSGINNIQAFDRVDAVVDFKVLAQLLAIAVALTAVSSLASMISIQKFSPLTILKERS